MAQLVHWYARIFRIGQSGTFKYLIPIIMEQPLFKDNVAEFDTYLSELGKPVEKRITFYISGPGIE